MTDPRTKLVGDGYDARVDAWETWSEKVTDDPRHAWAARLASRLPEGARVLELGCGGGTRETRELAARFDLVGVDLSQRQLERARERVPDATFVHGDLTSIEFEAASFDAVAAFYVFNHVPRELLAPLLARIHSWLAPGGSLLAAFGTGDEEEWYGEWIGAPVFFSSFPPEVNSELVRDAAFTIVADEIVTLVEPEGPVPFQWILAERT
jgi:cyclopropane fatty-acyl-phospholipid synthase-like methyltransferase